MKIPRVKVGYHTTIRPTDSTLCCQINPAIQCTNCKTKLCMDCGQAWSGRRHFVLDLCRNRFTPEDIKQSNTCFKERIVNGVMPKGLGTCKICTFRRKNWSTNDRILLTKPRKR